MEDFGAGNEETDQRRERLDGQRDIVIEVNRGVEVGTVESVLLG